MSQVHMNYTKTVVLESIISISLYGSGKVKAVNQTGGNAASNLRMPEDECGLGSCSVLLVS